MVPVSETMNRLGFTANHWRPPSVWRNYQKPLLSAAPPNSPIASAAQGRSWAQLTSNLIHDGQVCSQVLPSLPGKKAGFCLTKITQGLQIPALHEAQSSHRWNLSQSNVSFPSQGNRRKGRTTLWKISTTSGLPISWFLLAVFTYRHLWKKAKDRSVPVHGCQLYLMGKNCAILLPGMPPQRGQKVCTKRLEKKLQES